MKFPVIITANEQGSLVSAYAKTPSKGYLKLSQAEIVIDGSWVGTRNRSTLLKGEVALLTQMLKAFPKLEMPGRLRVEEFTGGDIPEHYIRDYASSNGEPDEKLLAYYVKRAGKDGLELTRGGEQIFRFTTYDSSGLLPDILVEHDNHEELKSWQSARKAALKAELVDEKMPGEE